MSADPIPAITEAEATGETAMLFAELRAALDVPFVNLVWRHLATIPGGLSWTWSVLRPIYASPTLETVAQELRGAIAPGCEPLDAFVYDTVGVGAQDRQAIRSVISDYNQANSMNFLALSVARQVLRGGLRNLAGAESAAAVRRPAAKPVLPRLLGLNELSPSLHTLVRELDKLGRVTPNPAIASLYRHLGHWPNYLALAYTVLLPLHRTGFLWDEQERLKGRSHDLVAEKLAPLLQDVPPLPQGADNESILAGVESVITGRMTVMGTALLALLPNG